MHTLQPGVMARNTTGISPTRNNHHVAYFRLSNNRAYLRWRACLRRTDANRPVSRSYEEEAKTVPRSSSRLGKGMRFDL